MRFRPVALALSAAFLVTSGLMAGCTGDDNSLPLPPSDGGSDSGDAAKSDAGDAAKSEAGDAASDPVGDGSVPELDAGEEGSAADAPPGDGGSGG
jgi:hypothetical protein